MDEVTLGEREDETREPKARIGFGAVASVGNMRYFGTVAEMKAARESLGNPGTLAEAITATGIDALFVLLDGGTVEIEGRKLKAALVCAECGGSGERRTVASMVNQITGRDYPEYIVCPGCGGIGIKELKL